MNPTASMSGRLVPKDMWAPEQRGTVRCPQCLHSAGWWAEPGCADGVSYTIRCGNCAANRKAWASLILEATEAA
jgi:hypothetical protein